MGAKLKKSQSLIPGSGIQTEDFQDENKTHQHRMEINSESSSRVYIVAQAKSSGEWQCSCPGWKFKKPGRERGCKHLREMMPMLASLDAKPIQAPKKPKATKAPKKITAAKPKTPKAKKPKMKTLTANTPQKMLDILGQLIDDAGDDTIANMSIIVEYK